MFTSKLPPVAVGGTSVPAALLETCRANRTRVASIDAETGQQLTFGQLAHQIERIGAAMTDRNVRRGATVAIWAPNQPAWLAVSLGAMAAGASVTGISPLASDQEVTRHLKRCRVTTVVAAPAFVDRALNLRADRSMEVIALGGATIPTFGTPVASSGHLIASPAAPPDVGAIDDHDIALLPQSSGTTGLPKPVEISHRSLVTMLRQVSAALPFDPGEAVLALAPFGHAMGGILTGLWPLFHGMTVVTLPRFDPDLMLRTIADHDIALLIAPPLVAKLLGSHPGATAEALSSLRLIGFGGAPTPTKWLEPVVERFPQATVGQGYGMTELTCVAAMAGLDSDAPVDSVGCMLPNTELRVVDPHTGADLPVGATGELLIRGPQVMNGYRGLDDETASTVDPDGWLHTGDRGHIDEDGYLYLVGRSKDLIKVKGFQVAPTELEQVLVGHPDIEDAAVRAVEVEGDQRPAAFVVPVSGAKVDPEAIAAWVAPQVSPYKRLASVTLCETIPRNASGKVLRHQLPTSDAEAA